MSVQRARDCQAGHPHTERLGSRDTEEHEELAGNGSGQRRGWPCAGASAGLPVALQTNVPVSDAGSWKESLPAG
jgi:hypothetical protein